MATEQEMLNSAYNWYASQGAPAEDALALAIQAVQAAGMKASKKQPRSLEDIFQTDVGGLAGASTPGAYISPQEQFVSQSLEEIESTYGPQYVELRQYALENPESVEAKMFADIEAGVPYTSILAKLGSPGGYPGLDVSAETSAVKFQEYAAFAKYIKTQKDEIDKQLGIQQQAFKVAGTKDVYSEAGLPKPVSQGGPKYGLPKYEAGGLSLAQGESLPPELLDFYTKAAGVAAEKIPTPKGIQTIAKPTAADLERARTARTEAMAGMAGPSLQEVQALKSPQQKQAEILQENRRRVLFEQLNKRVQPTIVGRSPFTDAMRARLQVGP
jgi:hypothetical protein